MDRGVQNIPVKIGIDNFTIRRCTDAQLDDILRLQDEALQILPSQELLRRNTPEMLADCLRAPHITLGAWHEGILAAIAILYVPTTEEEDLSRLLTGVDLTSAKCANYKLCIVGEAYRGNALQYQMGARLIDCARDMGFSLLCATVSPHNLHSIRNIEKLGFHCGGPVEKYGFDRHLYYRFI